MKFGLSPTLLARAYRDPLSWANLAVDLLPILAVIQFGWSATPLVALYWLENLIIGAFTALRMIGAGLAQLRQLPAAVFMAAFFCVHYGAFCWGHGVFLAIFTDPTFGFPTLPRLMDWALTTAPHMVWFVGAIIAVNALNYIFDFIGRGDITRVSPNTEMMAPYGRIVTLHVAIIFGAVIAFGSNQPLLGVLLLILIRVVFGVFLSVRRRRKRDRQLADAANPAPATA